MYQEKGRTTRKRGSKRNSKTSTCLNITKQCWIKSKKKKKHGTGKEIPEDEIEVSTSIEPEKKRRRLFRMLSLNKVIIQCSSSRFINSNITTILRELYFWLSRQAFYSIFLLWSLLTMKLGYIYMIDCLKKSTVNVRISLQLRLVEMAKCFTLPHASFDLGNRTRNNKKENERQTWVTFHGVSFCYWSGNATRKERNHLRPPPQSCWGVLYLQKAHNEVSNDPGSEHEIYIPFFFP